MKAKDKDLGDQNKTCSNVVDIDCKCYGTLTDAGQSQGADARQTGWTRPTMIAAAVGGGDGGRPNGID